MYIEAMVPNGLKRKDVLFLENFGVDLFENICGAFIFLNESYYLELRRFTCKSECLKLWNELNIITFFTQNT